MRLSLSVLILGTLCCVSGQTLETQTCSSDRFKVDINANADVILGGIFDIRGPGPDGYGCGSPLPEMILVYEAVRWTLGNINNNNYIPGITLGMQGYDSCYSRFKAVRAAQDFYPQYSTSNMYCNSTGKMKLGLLAPVYSSTTKPVVALTGQFPVSVISPAAASADLSNEDKYPYFLRTGFATAGQVEAMIALMSRMGWKRIVVVYSSIAYGRDGAKEFARQAQMSEVCIVEMVLANSRATQLELQGTLADVGLLDVQGGVFFGTHGSLVNMLEALPSGSENIQWIVSHAITNADFQPLKMRGVIFVMSHFNVVTEFYDYYVTSLDENNPPAENPWYRDWYMRTFNCKLPGVTYPPYNILSDCTPKTEAQKRRNINTNYPFVDKAIMAVYAFAKALKTAQSSKCGASPGLCPALEQMSREEFHSILKRVDFTLGEPGININSLQNTRVAFVSNGDFISAAHDYWNYQETPSTLFEFVNVGTHDNGLLDVDFSQLKMYDGPRTQQLPAIPESPCPMEGCSNCIVPRNEVRVNYIEGDVIIMGLFDIHRRGSEVFTCGQLAASHALEASAFMYGINRAKSFFQQGILNGVKLGSMVVDLCDDADKGRTVLNNILGGRRIVRDMNGNVIDPNLLQAAVGTLDSTEAISIAELLGEFEMPQMDSAATSPVLSNDDMFPYFSRAIPSDQNLMKALVLMVKKMGWTYIQVVYTDDAYGRGSYELIRQIGAENGICVAASHIIRDDNHDMVVSALLNTPDARAVIGAAGGSDFRQLLQQIQLQNLQGRFLLLGTETWANKASVISGLEIAAQGSLTVGIISPAAQGFRNWIDTLNPQDQSVHETMPFFREWYQNTFSCYLDANNRETYGQQCASNQLISNSPLYQETAYSRYLIASTYAAAQAIDMALKQYCGANYDGICWQFRSDDGVKQVIRENMRNVMFSIDNSEFKVVDGEGQANYAIYNIQNGVYQRVGTFETSSGLLEMETSQLSVPAGFESRCSQCGSCTYLLQTKPFVQWEAGAPLLIGANLAVHDPAQTQDPLQCSGLRLTNGIQSYLAISYALTMLNDNMAPVTLNDVKVGALLLDHCNSPLRAYGLPEALYAGLLDKEGQFDANSDLNKIKAWITDNSLVTEQMKSLATDFNLPLVSAMATSNSFLDEDDYPNFIRTIQGDSTVATALAILAKSLGLQYVSIVYSDNSYGMDGMEAFNNIAPQEGVCIINTFKMEGSPAAVVAQLVAQPTNVVVTYLSQADMAAFIDARAGNSAGSDLVILSPESWPLLYKEKGANAANILSLRMNGNPLNGYLNYLNNLDYEMITAHGFLTEWYQDLFECNMPGNYRYTRVCSNPVQPITSSAKFYQDNYVLSTINAVYSIAGAAHETLKMKCGGDNYTGVCTSFYSDLDTNVILAEKMGEVSFQDMAGADFEFVGPEGNTGRQIQMFNGSQMITVADFAGASINFVSGNYQDMYAGTLSQCTPPCDVCIRPNMNFTYIPGDILLAGVFDVHESAFSPFACGDIKTWHGFQLLEAFHYAIGKVNDKSGMFQNILKNVKLGGVGLDACESKIRTGYIVSNINSRITQLERNGEIINPDDINTYIGSYSSDHSIYLARIMKDLKIPQVSFGSSSTELLDKDKYPYFLRTVPADDKQAMAMVRMLQKFDIRYVQIVFESTNYGEQGEAIFRKLAEENQICVAQSVVFPYVNTITAESANDVVLALLEKPTANTVITFAGADVIQELLKAINRNSEAQNKFKFVGSDTWANNVEAIAGVEKYAEDAITYDLQHTDLRHFDDYLSTKTPSNYPENPWFTEYYEEIHDCYLTVPSKRYSGRCPSSPKNIVTARRYKQDTVIIHVINAVYAAAYGFHGALQQVCGPDYTTVCEAFKNLETRRNTILSEIRKAAFTDISGESFRFSDRNDGERGYIMYSIEPSNILGYVYTPVATYSSSGALALTGAYTPNWDGSCNRDDACTECPLVRNRLQRYMLQSNPQNPNFPEPATFILGLGVHQSGTDPYRCGTMDLNNFVQGLMFFYTIEDLLPSRSFGLRGLVLDTCGNQIRLDQDLYNLLAKGELCNAEFQSDAVVDASTIVGVQVGGSGSVVGANRVLAPLKIPLVSGYATSTALSNTENYPYFARTVPPDDLQMKVIANLLKENGWRYVNVVYTTSPYGISAYRALRDYINTEKKSCVAQAIELSPLAKIGDARAAVRTLAEKKGAGVVIVIADNPRLVLQAADAEGVANKYLWVGTDAWGTFGSVVEGFSHKFFGSITVNFRDAFINNFVNWMSVITYTVRRDMPDDWFEEFYQLIHECHLSDAKVVFSQFPNACTKQEKINAAKVQKTGVGLHWTAATYVFGNALREVNNLRCDQGSTSPTIDLQDCMAKNSDFREFLFSKLLEQTWDIANEGNLQLTPNEDFNVELGDDRFWDSGYNVYYVTGDPNQMYKPIGSQQGDAFSFNKTMFDYLMRPEVESDCPEKEICNCDYGDNGNQPIVQPQNQYQRPEEPRNYYVYDEDTGAKAYTWPIWAIVVAVLTCFWLLVGIILFIYFLVMYPVRGGSTVLGFLMIIGCLGILAINFAWFLPASEATCGARRFCLGVVYAIVFAALFVKAVDNWRFSNVEMSAKAYKGITSPLSLIMVAMGIVLIQVIIPTEWLILVRPSASLNVVAERHDWMWCDPHDFHDISLVLSMIFVMALVILTAIFAAMAWDSESNYYESRWIFVGCVCTAGCFLVWMIVTTNAGPPYRDPTLAIANMVNAAVLLICLPIRKLILLIKIQNENEKEKNMPPDMIQADKSIYSATYDNQTYEPDVFVPEYGGNGSVGGDGYSGGDHYVVSGDVIVGSDRGM